LEQLFLVHHARLLVDAHLHGDGLLPVENPNQVLRNARRENKDANKIWMQVLQEVSLESVL